VTLHYETFATDEQFVAWQDANPGVPIYQMIPIALEGVFKEDGLSVLQKTNANLTYGIFVVYDDKPKEN